MVAHSLQSPRSGSNCSPTNLLVCHVAEALFQLPRPPFFLEIAPFLCIAGIRYFSVVVIKHHGQKLPMEERACSGLWRQGKSPSWQQGECCKWQGGRSRSRELRDNILHCKQEQTGNWRDYVLSRPVSGDLLPPAKPHLPKLPTLGTKCSNTRGHRGHFSFQHPYLSLRRAFHELRPQMCTIIPSMACLQMMRRMLEAQGI